MAIEIREIIIRTEIFTSDRNQAAEIREKDLYSLKKSLLEECKKIFTEGAKKNSYKR